MCSESAVAPKSNMFDVVATFRGFRDELELRQTIWETHVVQVLVETTKRAFQQAKYQTHLIRDVVENMHFMIVNFDVSHALM